MSQTCCVGYTAAPSRCPILFMIRLLYSTLFALCLPFVFLKLLWRGYKAPEYRPRKRERFGLFKAPALRHSIWFHTVSVGELLAAEPVIREIQRRFPERSIVITSMTPTSSALIHKLFGRTVFHVYAPYDLPLFVGSFLRKIKPEFLVIMETELWPNMIHKTHKLGCPVVIANARLSERSARGYQRLRPAISWMLDGLSMVLCQYPNDAQRFRDLDIAANKIHVTGSVKYDIEIADDSLREGVAIRAALGTDQKIWIAASTHEGEDALLLDVHAKLYQRFPGLVLVLVPRHPERFESTYQLAKRYGFRCDRRTTHACIDNQTDVFVVDTMGELMAFYAAADIAFIGGSFVEIGGHNPIEPAVLSKPILMGPHIFNFEAICEQLIAAEGLQVVADSLQLEQAMVQLLDSPEEVAARGAKAASVVQGGRGAVNRVVDHLNPLIQAIPQ